MLAFTTHLGLLQLILNLNYEKVHFHLKQNIPDDSTLDDIIHVLYIRAKIEHSEKEILEGKGISHEEAKKRLEKWLK